MGKVKDLQTDIQYIMNVLSARGEQKAFESFENVLKTLGYEPTTNVRDGAILIPLPELGDTLLTVGQVRGIMSELDDSDIVVVEVCDEHGDVEDLYPMSMDIIEGIELTDGTIVREVRFCQRPNSEPDTRDKQPLVDAVIAEIKSDINTDVTVLNELLMSMPWNILAMSLPDDLTMKFLTEDPLKESVSNVLGAIDNVLKHDAVLIPVETPNREQLIDLIMISAYGDDDIKYYDSNRAFLDTLSDDELETKSKLFN